MYACNKLMVLLTLVHNFVTYGPYYIFTSTIVYMPSFLVDVVCCLKLFCSSKECVPSALFRSSKQETVLGVEIHDLACSVLSKFIILSFPFH